MDYYTFLTVLEKFQEKFPVDVHALAKELKINVYRATDEEGCSGKIAKDPKRGGESGYAIYVNATHPHVRKRFTIAHEIAHYILHRDEIGDGIVDNALYRSDLSNQMESEANKLAAEILMPWHLLNSAIDNNIDTVAKLAEQFQVSETAMSIRLNVPC